MITDQTQTDGLSTAEGTSTDNRISSSELCEGVGIAVSTDSLQIMT